MKQKLKQVLETIKNLPIKTKAISAILVVVALVLTGAGIINAANGVNEPQKVVVGINGTDVEFDSSEVESKKQEIEEQIKSENPELSEEEVAKQAEKELEAALVDEAKDKVSQETGQSKDKLAVTQKPVQPQTKPSETKPAETKPTENKPVENKPVENKPSETKPTENKPVENKPVENKPSETKPAETKPQGNTGTGTTGSGSNTNGTQGSGGGTTNQHTPVVTTKTEERTTVLNAEIIYRDDNTIEKGKQVVSVKPVNGKVVKTYKITYTDGKKTGETLVDTKTTDPINGLTLIGTKEAPKQNAPLNENIVRDEYQVLLNLINNHRASMNLPKLSTTSKMQRYANIRAYEAATVTGVSHYRPDGSEFSTVGDYLVAENITGGGASIQTAQHAFNNWLNSPSHRATLESNPSYDITISVGSFTNAEGFKVWVMLLGMAH